MGLNWIELIYLVLYKIAFELDPWYVETTKDLRGDSTGSPGWAFGVDVFFLLWVLGMTATILLATRERKAPDAPLLQGGEPAAVAENPYILPSIAAGISLIAWVLWYVALAKA